jgi:hypothetical protein
LDGTMSVMTEPTNAEIMVELKKLSNLVKKVVRRLKALEGDMAVLRAAYAQQGKSIGDLLRSTPLPPPEELPKFDEEDEDDDDDEERDTNPSLASKAE